MKKQIGAVLLCGALCFPLLSLATEGMGTPPPPELTPYVQTPSPAELAAPTRAPRGWRAVGGGGFDINEMTVEERAALISDLQNANLLDQVQSMPLVSGLDSTRESPVYMGQRAQFKQEITFVSRDDHKQMGTVSIAMTEVVRGTAATQLVFEMNALNEPPPQDKEYVVAYFDVGITTDTPEEMFTFTMYEFQPVDSRGKILDYAFVTDNMNVLSLYSGGQGVLRVTALAEPGTELFFRYREHVWFSTRQLDPEASAPASE